MSQEVGDGEAARESRTLNPHQINESGKSPIRLLPNNKIPLRVSRALKFGTNPAHIRPDVVVFDIEIAANGGHKRPAAGIIRIIIQIRHVGRVRAKRQIPLKIGDGVCIPR